MATFHTVNVFALHNAARNAPSGDQVTPLTFAGSGHFGLVLEKGSSLTGCVDKALAVLKSKGTLAQIQKVWLSDKANAPVLH